MAEIVLHQSTQFGFLGISVVSIFGKVDLALRVYYESSYVGIGAIDIFLGIVSMLWIALVDG